MRKAGRNRHYGKCKTALLLGCQPGPEMARRPLSKINMTDPSKMTCAICGRVDGRPAGGDHPDWCGPCVSRYEFLLANRDDFRMESLELFCRMMAIRSADATREP